MPLDRSGSDASLKKNIGTLMGEVGSSPHVQSREQALAIAYDIKRRGKADGGGLALGGAPASWQVRSEARSMMHTGPIVSAVPGRTDMHNMSVPSGAYVIPAQAISHLGQSNSIAGMRVAHGIFGPDGPYGTPGIKIAHGAGAPKPPRARAAGGMADHGGARGEGDLGVPVDVVTAGGEYVVDPHIVQNIGDGDISHGHNIMDSWVNSVLDEHIKELKKLPGPAKS